MEGKASSAKLDTKHKNKLFFLARERPNIYNLQRPPHSRRSKVRYASTNQQVRRILSLCAVTNTLAQLNGDITVDSSVHGNIPTVRSGEFSQLQAAAETYVPAYRTPNADIYSGAATGTAKIQAAHNPL